VSSPAPEGVRRIAVLRANGIGDLAFALPALDALRARFRRSEIVLLGLSWHAELLGSRPSPVDRVEILPPSALDDPSRPDDDVRAFLDRMRSQRFDLAVQLHGGGRISNPLVRSIGATTTVGMRTPDADPLDRWIPYVYYQAEITRYLEVVALVGARPVTLDPFLAVTRGDLAAADHAAPPDGRPLVVLHPGATDPRRRWPADAFAAVGDAMHARGARVVVTGTRAEVHPTRDVAASMHRAPFVAIDTSLSALVGLLARAGLVVANDSGPLHLAGAIGTPTVGIYWSFVADVPIAGVLSAADDLLGLHPMRPDARVDRPSRAFTTRGDDPAGTPSGRPPRDGEASSAPPGGRHRTA